MLSLKKDEDSGPDLFYFPLKPENLVWDKIHPLSSGQVHWTVCGEEWEKGGKEAENRAGVWGEKTQNASFWHFNLLFQIEVSIPNFFKLKKKTTTKPSTKKQQNKKNPKPTTRKQNKKTLWFSFFSSHRECLLWLRIMFWGDRENEISVSKQKFFIFVSALNTNIFSLYFCCGGQINKINYLHSFTCKINFVILMLNPFFFPK